MRLDETVGLLKMFQQMNKLEQEKIIRGFQEAASNERVRLLKELEKFT